MSEFDPIRTGSPELAEWLRTHPNPIVLRATFDFPALPEAMSAEQHVSDRLRDHAGRLWPADRRGRAWPRDRWGNPTCPLDEYPPGVAPPGTAPHDPYDAKSPWFDPVLVLQKVGFLPADLREYIRDSQEASAAATALRAGPAQPQEASAIYATAADLESAGRPTMGAGSPPPEPERGARQLLVVSDTEADRSGDSVGGRVGPSHQPAYPGGVWSMPFGPVEALLAIVAAFLEGSAAGLLALVGTIPRQFLPDFSWLFGERSAEPSSNPAAPEAPLPVRSADLDRGAWEEEQYVKQRRANELDKRHLSAAQDDLRGRFIPNPRTGGVYNHLQEVRDAQRGVRNAIERLQKKIKHYEDYGSPRPDASIDDAKRVLARMRAFLEDTERLVPPDSHPPEGP